MWQASQDEFSYSEGIAGTPRLLAMQKAERKARKAALLKQQAELNRENEGAT